MAISRASLVSCRWVGRAASPKAHVLDAPAPVARRRHAAVRRSRLSWERDATPPTAVSRLALPPPQPYLRAAGRVRVPPPRRACGSPLG
jgi:hypothetical protein